MNILITGGASGLGEAITRILAKDERNKVYFTYSSSEINAKMIANEFSNTVSIKCNFKDSGSIKGLIEQIKQLDLDVLINNAYSSKPINTYFHKIESHDFLSEFKDNVLPTILITQAAIHSFRKKKSGKLITILTSYLLNSPPIGSAIYVANKAYLASLIKSWANENIRFNMTSNSISPSFMQTKLTSDLDDRVTDQIIANHPLKRLLTVGEVAETVLFLTHASAQINGVDIVINSGANIK